MATTYTKLFQSILASTVWQESLPTKVVWVTMLALSDRDGRIWASVPGLAHAAGVQLEDCRIAIKKFLGPDLDSRTKDNEGRRIVEIDGGWELLNHAKYRQMMSKEERRDYNRLKQSEYRKRKKDAGLAGKQAGAQQAIKEGLEQDYPIPSLH